jgi:prepilin-type processing-associated H-X9-DG protein
MTVSAATSAQPVPGAQRAMTTGATSHATMAPPRHRSKVNYAFVDSGMAMRVPLVLRVGAVRAAASGVMRPVPPLAATWQAPASPAGTGCAHQC